MLNLLDHDEADPTVPLFRLAFRPFFLGGVLFSLLALSLWAIFWMAGLTWIPYGGWIWWHAHEMIYGFVVAIMTGFLLTAVQNWTGQPSITGWSLAGLFTLWLLPRGLLLYPTNTFLASLLPWLDLAFLPVVAWVMGRILWRARQLVNLVFVPILLLLTISNAKMHWAVAQGDAMLFKDAAESAIFIIVFVMVVIGGRVIPFFTANGTDTPRVLPNPVIEILSLGSVALLALLHLFSLIQHLSPLIVAGLFMVAGLAHLLRFIRWRPWITYKEPLLWSLHFAYLFITIGLILSALRYAGLSLDVLGRFSASYPTILHSFTLGGMGLLILAMMSRISLGHTGRPLVVNPWFSISFLLIIAAYAYRVWLPLISPSASHYSSYLLSIILWLFGYGLFLIVYLPILSKPRVDGRPG